jgi:hypothetical protein
MRLNTPRFPIQKVAPTLLAIPLIFLLLRPAKIDAQRNPPPPVAQVGVGSPLPVFMVNEQPPVLPDGFVPGTSWKFTTWTMPSTLTFTATVQKTEGGWAFLKLVSDTETTARWYYVPQMPGAWELMP